MIPTIDLSTVLKLGVRKVVSSLFKSSLSLLIGVSVLLSALVTTLCNFFDISILPPMPDVISFQPMTADAPGWWSTVCYVLALDTATDLLSYFYTALDKIVVFSISFLVSGFFVSVFYRWSASFKRDLESLTTGI